MRPITQSFSVAFQYQVQFTHQLFQAENPLLRDIFPKEVISKLYFVIDQGVAEAHPQLSSDIQQYVQAHQGSLSLFADPLIVPGGEPVKNDTLYLKQIVEAVDQYCIDRHSYIVAIGGGAVLDMAGFAAAISHRGVRHIRIPTTVLSQNDSGVGVKNGVNFFGKKNFLGTFAPPYAVINDSAFLLTLDDRDWRSGIAEAIKVALIKDIAFWEKIEQDAPALVNRDLATMQELIHRCAEIHLQHIAGGDPFESGSSRPLDFGHWAAHKLEQLTEYQLRHGEAVAIGIALDVAYSFRQGMLTQEEFHRIIELILQLGFAIYTPELDTPELLQGLDEFREHLGGQLTVMLLEKIGKGVEVHEMDKNVIQQAIHQLATLQNTGVLS
uniref:3-dehydroquinate synthase n=1 Tax=Roseihalotalea indica TaxID=2867963 RepID=A0AA49GR95_9BACT|nr:3-dehydroquinate synthase [Tunicatimonas sp. TK19036]